MATETAAFSSIEAIFTQESANIHTEKLRRRRVGPGEIDNQLKLKLATMGPGPNSKLVPGGLHIGVLFVAGTGRRAGLRGQAFGPAAASTTIAYRCDKTTTTVVCEGKE